MTGSARVRTASMMNFYLAGKFSATSFTSRARERKRAEMLEEGNNS